MGTLHEKLHRFQHVKHNALNVYGNNSHAEQNQYSNHFNIIHSAVHVFIEVKQY
jgi:hypothetical protein